MLGRRNCLLVVSPPSSASIEAFEGCMPPSLPTWMLIQHGLDGKLDHFWYKQQWHSQNSSSRLHFLPTTGLMGKRVSEAGHIFLVGLQMVNWSENWARNQVHWELVTALLLTYCITPFTVFAQIFCCFFWGEKKRNLPCFHWNHSYQSCA